MKAFVKALSGRPDKRQEAGSKSQNRQIEEKPFTARAVSDRSSEIADTPSSSTYAPLQTAADVDLTEGQSASSWDTSASPSHDIFTRQSFFEQYPGEAVQRELEPRGKPQQRAFNRDSYIDSRRMYQQKPLPRPEGMRPIDATLGKLPSAIILARRPVCRSESIGSLLFGVLVSPWAGVPASSGMKCQPWLSFCRLSG